MFDVSPNEIAELSDTDLREFIGRLCEAELVSRGISTAAVTWGGSQTASDGGLDVHVALPPETSINGFISRPSTGFQVKTPAMPRGEILAEMRPKGAIRPVILDLLAKAGSYVIVSSKSSTSDSALRNRRDAMREAIEGIPCAEALHTDFYDRTRLATWVRSFPGVVLWVKETIGRSLAGWRSYGSWSGIAEGVNAEYLLDDKLRLHLGTHLRAPAQSIDAAIDALRDELASRQKVVRLVGLSGVGKTRLAQALFDTRIGARPLPSSLAVYTNLSDNPDPQPIGLASDLIANRTRAILIIDNCPPDLHRRLSEVCTAPDSNISVLTIEYDVREDVPEGTQVVTLETSSPALIERLVTRRYPHISQVNARTIATLAGGNARVAIALAGTVKQTESIASISDDDLFKRLFQQRQDPNDALLRAAQACSLLYSFQGEALTGIDAELPHLANLAGQSVAEIYRHVGELLRRDLVQQRSVWRAVLPHAIANRLAARALEDTPYDLIERTFMSHGAERLARSFSRRLSFLHENAQAKAIVAKWLAPNGMLSDVEKLNALGLAMFENVAPVFPEAALAALERACDESPEAIAVIGLRHRSLLRSIAYEPALFERSATLLQRAATGSANERDRKDAEDIFASLFTIYLSGSHATIEQRLELVERLLKMTGSKQRSLGLAALSNLLKTQGFRSMQRFEFGARSRDYGYHPKKNEDFTHWYGSTLKMMEIVVLNESAIKPELRALLAKKFDGLWSSGFSVLDQLETLSNGFSAEGFWREGWMACRKVLSHNTEKLSRESTSRLNALEIKLRPSNLSERVRASVLGDRWDEINLGPLNFEASRVERLEHLDAMARSLGSAVALDEPVFNELLPDILRGGGRTWEFGGGLADASKDPRATWARLVAGLEELPPEHRDVRTLSGYLEALWKRDRNLAEALLDGAIELAPLAPFFPVLNTSVPIDSKGVNRLKKSLQFGQAKVHMYRNLAYGRTTDHLEPKDLGDLLLAIAEKPQGFEVAIEILDMHLFSGEASKQEHEQVLLESARSLLRHFRFERTDERLNHKLANIVRICLRGFDGVQVALELVGNLKEAWAAHEAYIWEDEEILGALLTTQSMSTLTALFPKGEEELQTQLHMLAHLDLARSHPFDGILCDELITWCDLNPEVHYPIAASFVSFTLRTKGIETQRWSEQAKALLTNSPNPQLVLTEFVNRFQPNSWTGSRAARTEANMRLLDELDGLIPAKAMYYVEGVKSRLKTEIARSRQSETERDKASDERFE